MAQIVLLTGQPGHGKSFAARLLEGVQPAYVSAHTDDWYVGFIFSRKHHLWEDHLHNVVAQHYLANRHHFDSEWKQFLISKIEKLADSNERVLIEGWQLSHHLNDLVAYFESKNHEVLAVIANERLYSLAKSVLRLEELVKLLK